MEKLGITKSQQEEIIAAKQDAETDQEKSVEVARKQHWTTFIDLQSAIAIKSSRTSKYDKLIGGNLTMTTFNKQGLKLAEEIKTNIEYNFIKKEALIQFGFNPISLGEFVEWVSYSFMEDFEEITGDNVQNERRYTPEMIDLLTESEHEEIGDFTEVDNPNEIVGYLTTDGQTTPATHEIEYRKRKERFVNVNKKKWFDIGQSLKAKRLELGITLTKMGQILRTSSTRISNLENGKGVMMAEHLIAGYKLALDLERIKQKGKWGW
ncbi:helix-turn-helix domain-containing protein [Cytobacillus kochii]|uniref:helix-turn-helix domain-containing protein n=1 Tax=Cytobacillus kochii TaxID=859143 RepID=UPI00203CBA8C|nr:helix-turn-helix transcriptional regulator [Cytobacillus kochii]MCM3325038.1 helix-turn-helix transcriptional regulator [Cytobacillus kochii]MCM3347425.1 helix-turn-helix transcriptional regulator [Cytobacillus kochii]